MFKEAHCPHGVNVEVSHCPQCLNEEIDMLTEERAALRMRIIDLESQLDFAHNELRMGQVSIETPEVRADKIIAAGKLHLATCKVEECTACWRLNNRGY